jgi:putative holliday junction resolvase
VSRGGCSTAAASSTAGSFEEDAAATSLHCGADGSVLAFDFGMRRIGVAVGDTRLRIAHPLATIAAEDNRSRFEAIAALVAEWQPVRLVLGCPASAGGAMHALMPALLRFERRLAARFGLPIERVDETLSSWDASRRMSTVGTAARFQKQRLDAMAACVILEAWFERGNAPRPQATEPSQ